MDTARRAALAATDDKLQNSLLPGVSRTFALTIPQLPQALKPAVTNAYLLCRLADTIEDDPSLQHNQKARFHGWFIELVDGRASDHDDFVAQLLAALGSLTPDTEKKLIGHTAEVVAVTHSLRPTQRQAIQRCVRIMCTQMPAFERNNTRRGLRDQQEMDDYCYAVAGVVGEMLTELFCEYAPSIEAQRVELEKRAVSFGQGLQMTNIIKDIWDDWGEGRCWLPRQAFAKRGIELEQLEQARGSEEYAAAIRELTGIAHGHLRDALDYTLLIPRREKGIRRFCLWAIGLAILTLRNIQAQPHFRDGAAVKVSRSTVKRTVAICQVTQSSNWMLRSLFNWATRELPLASQGTTPQLLGQPTDPS